MVKTPEELVEEAKKIVRGKTPAEVKDIISREKEAIILDVREKNEYDSGHIENSILIPRGTLEMKIGKKIPEKTKTIVVYCQMGGRSALAGATLKILGYENVCFLSGGIEAWQKHGFPTVSGQ